MKSNSYKTLTARCSDIHNTYNKDLHLRICLCTHMGETRESVCRVKICLWSACRFNTVYLHSTCTCRRADLFVSWHFCYLSIRIPTNHKIGPVDVYENSYIPLITLVSEHMVQSEIALSDNYFTVGHEVRCKGTYCTNLPSLYIKLPNQLIPAPYLKMLGGSKVTLDTKVVHWKFSWIKSCRSCHQVFSSRLVYWVGWGFF